MTAPGIEPGKAERHQPQSFFSFKRRQSSVPLFCFLPFILVIAQSRAALLPAMYILFAWMYVSLSALSGPKAPNRLRELRFDPWTRPYCLCARSELPADPMPQRSLIARGFNLTLIFLRRKILSNCLTKLIYLNYLQSISNFIIKMFPFYRNIH